jgi:hypothetical protein
MAILFVNIVVLTCGLERIHERHAGELYKG